MDDLLSQKKMLGMICSMAAMAEKIKKPQSMEVLELLVARCE